MTKRKVITVDGLAGSGKTTLSRLLAQKLSWIHFNTGSIYRAVGYLALCNNLDYEDQEQLLKLLKTNKIEVRRVGSVDVVESSAQVFLNNVNIENQIRIPEISQAASKVASLPKIRQSLLAMQREIFPESDIVVEGRDMGTVVFPDAQLKFFIETDENVRKQRRMAQFEAAKSASAQVPTAEANSLESLMNIEIEERDKRDQTRTVAPTIPASDAVIIDNSTQNLTAVLQKMYDTAVSRLGNN